MKILRFLIIIGIATGFGFSALAQTDTSKKSALALTNAQKAFLHNTFPKANYTPGGGAGLLNAVSNIAVNSTLTGGANGKVQAVKQFGDFWSASLSAQQTLGKSDSSATFYDFSKGISPGTSISFNLQKMFWNPKTTVAQFNNFSSLADKYAKRTGMDRRSVTYDEIQTYGTDEEKAALFKLVLPVFLNLQVSFTKSSFDYTTDSVHLKKSSQAYFLPSIKLNFGIPFSLTSYLSFSYLYTENYKAGTSMTFNSPFGTTGNTLNQTIIFGAPKQQIDHRAGIEYRQTYGPIDEPDFAIDPSVTYGFSTKKIAVELPLYFIKGVTSKTNKPNGLQGGFSLGYISGTSTFSSFKQGFGAQVILTAPFDVFADLLK